MLQKYNINLKNDFKFDKNLKIMISISKNILIFLKHYFRCEKLEISLVKFQ